MSNEVGQGTITMWTAASDATHSYDQGCVQALGVFFNAQYKNHGCFQGAFL